MMAPAGAPLHACWAQKEGPLVYDRNHLKGGLLARKKRSTAEEG